MTNGDFEYGSDTATDRFLLDEGLDLLARYRSIHSTEIRLALLRLITAIADGQHHASLGSANDDNQKAP